MKNTITWIYSTLQCQLKEWWQWLSSIIESYLTRLFRHQWSYSSMAARLFWSWIYRIVYEQGGWSKSDLRSNFKATKSWNGSWDVDCSLHPAQVVWYQNWHWSHSTHVLLSFSSGWRQYGQNQAVESTVFFSEPLFLLLEAAVSFSSLFLFRLSALSAFSFCILFFSSSITLTLYIASSSVRLSPSLIIVHLELICLEYPCGIVL